MRNIISAAITAVPLTALSNISAYLMQDWEFARWVAVLIVIDTFLSVVKHFVFKDVSSDEFWKGFFRKIVCYLALMMLSNVLAHYTVDGQAVGSTEWMSKYLCVFMIVREAISIMENINAIYPMFPENVLRKFRDFDDDGRYSGRGDDATRSHRTGKGKRGA